MRIPSDRVVYYHWRAGFNATFAFTALPYETDTQEIEVNVAFCAKKDIFNKKRGRLIAAGRLAKGGLIVDIRGCVSYGEVMTRVLVAFSDNEEVPRHVKEAMAGWT